MADVKVTVGLDASELDKQLKKINSEIRQTDKKHNN